MKRKSQDQNGHASHNGKARNLGVDHNSTQYGKLVLADGDVIEGVSFGAMKSKAGEVVFNTGMVGYPEALTDPSYAGQILVLTSPMVGNYGVPPDTRDEWDLPKFFESDKIHIAALIVCEHSGVFSHWNAAQSLSQWLQDNGVPALSGVDTRYLTKKIRESGALLGKVEFAGQPIPFDDPNERNLVREVSVKKIRTFASSDKDAPNIIAFDCGIKYNIIRQFIAQGVNLTVVPYDYDLRKNPAKVPYDGIFLSNGPGDPTMAAETIATLQWALAREPPTPIFGICLGNQLMALACGAKTFKMKYGNRGMNQPCIDLRTSKCYITPQNHGFAVDPATLPADWKSLFLNANDLTNEGIMHASKPFFSAQFHPEACGGPHDTSFLFTDFIDMVRGRPPARVLLEPALYERTDIRRVLLVGSGGLSIGQAGEFDYSGSQAIKALKEEGLEVILINPNIATVQTSKNLGKASPDKVYFLPIRAGVVEEIIAKERPDGVIVSMGGQTALNVGIELWKKGVFERYSCRVLGTPIETIIATEDREIFSQKLKEINETLAESQSATNIEEAVKVAKDIGFPVLVRAAFALGGLGSGFAENEEQLREQCAKAFAVSEQILIDQDLRGWKEVEYEVVRDCRDNCITVCNMENFDPLGVHTGDSIVVAPSQTLSNSEYFKLRATSIKVIRSLGIVGECNIQYALNPHSEQYCIIEVNARLSRSSALASKATGYPLAYVATKLSLGKDLVSIRNSVNKTTTACFEPSLDYCVVKMPRWDLHKFSMVSTRLGSSMISVGEVMSIGRNFEEAIQKACRMVSGGASEGLEGIYGNDLKSAVLSKPSASKKSAKKGGKKGAAAAADDDVSKEDFEELLRVPTNSRLFVVQTALEKGYSIDDIHRLSRIDRWFLSKLANIAKLKEATSQKMTDQMDYHELLTLKRAGFSDRQIARYSKSSELIVRRRRQQLGITPFCKQIDTLAAEFPAQTNYLYLTYHGSAHDVTVSASEMAGAHSPISRARKVGGTCGSPISRNGAHMKAAQAAQAIDLSRARTSSIGQSKRGVMVLGCGAYCIGSSVEFDWCAVSAVRQIRNAGDRAIVVNYNPETVSTDYDESDALYFEELTLERVLDIYELEKAEGVIVSVGGQIPNNLSTPLHQQGVRILGTSPASIDTAEDRHKFSALLDDLGVDQPEWKELVTVADAHKFAKTVHYPVLVRPSFVLSGAAMRVASTQEELTRCLQDAAEVSADKPVVISKYVTNAKEIEFDAVASGGSILNYAISEHVENAGVHSGDATLVLPAQKLYVQTVRAVKQIASQIAMALRITGPFNIQLLAKDNEVKVIECNLRASRTFPFISKTFDVNFITLATKAMLGYPCKPYNISLYDYDFVGVKAPMFSFTRLRGADPTLGVEMSSTGEVACFGHTLHEAFMQALLSSTFKLPEKSDDKHILVSIAENKMRAEFAESIALFQEMGYNIACTPGTADFYHSQYGYNVTKLLKPEESADGEGEGEGMQVDGAAAAAATQMQTQNGDGSKGTVIEWIHDKKIDLVINIPEGTTRRDEVTAGYLMRRAAVDFGVGLLTDIKCAVLFCESLHRTAEVGLPCKSAEEFIGVPMVGYAV